MPSPNSAFASTLVDEWVRCGLSHAVVCPGSRSTPLVVALASHPEMTVHVRLDERSAAFTALGIGRALGVPALVVTTSGTAAAELHAAVVEADLDGVPLIACTADRPPELQNVGAPQAIDQTLLFGRSVRWFCDPGVPSWEAHGSWRSLAARSVAEARRGSGGPGPVHLNLAFREPLLGDRAAGVGVLPGRPAGAPWHRVSAEPADLPPGAMDELLGYGGVDPRRRGLIVAGDGCGDPEAVFALARVLRWPVLAEPRSGLRVPRSGVIGAAHGILGSGRFAEVHRPETVLRLGGPWVSKVVNRFLSDAAAAGAPTIAVDPWGRWRDPERVVSTFVRADPTLFCQAAAARLAARSPNTPNADHGNDWCRGWEVAESAARQVIAELRGGPQSEPALAHRLFARMPSGSNLVVSSSMPVRDLESFAVARANPPRVLANRGANGIDGVISTALGVSLGSSSPTVALVGDLAFLHDVSAMVRTADLACALTVVVADNQGGGIFSFLEQARMLETQEFETLFGTPQVQDVAAVATGFGWPVDDCPVGDDQGAFEELLDRRLAEGSMSVIRLRLPGRDDNVALHRRIDAAIVDAVEAGLP
jgi:2-succinyl-5-enolpyruvyl-6-hydroxy-3-cyclohexene-1-carboxylate synthase